MLISQSSKHTPVIVAVLFYNINSFVTADIADFHAQRAFVAHDVALPELLRLHAIDEHSAGLGIVINLMLVLSTLPLMAS